MSGLNMIKVNDFEYQIESILILMEAMRRDLILNEKVLNMLKLDSYPRHIVLSNWLEQLRLNKAPKKLTQTLTYLFDDNFAEKVYNLINKVKAKK